MASSRPHRASARKVSNYETLNSQGRDTGMDIEEGQIVEDSPLQVEAEDDDFTDHHTETISSTPLTPVVINDKDDESTITEQHDSLENDYARDKVWRQKEAAINEA